ncbi:glycerophosphodiester phosphodiesterase [candidate division GN15 bacterium]|nr:glycerophosphodiester phosphodiesterase [candidate division GN15 bacterium]
MRSFTDLSLFDNPFIIAHRGSSVRETENTPAAFEAAIEDKADAVELDVRRTADNVLVVHHDPAVTGTTKTIADMTVDEVRDAGRAAGVDVPTLAEVVALCRGRIALDVESKEAGYEAEVAAVLTAHFDPEHILFTSFHDTSVRRLKELVPDARAGLLLGAPPPRTVGQRMSEAFPAARVRRSRCDVVLPIWHLMRLGVIPRLRRQKMPVIVWTVDEPRIARQAIRRGALGIITNDPLTIRDHLGSTSQ